MMEDKEADPKKRILGAAARVFAEKGFDGARVDDIAKRASVNKALIYYYFKGKEELLELLFEETMRAAIGLMKLPEMKTFDFQDSENTTRMLYSFLDVLEEHQDTVRVMLMESLKRTPVNDLIFSLIRSILDDIFAAVEESGAATVSDRDFGMVMEFFTGIMPLLSYVVYHEIWMERFGIPEAILRERFVRAFIGTHFAFSAQAYVQGGRPAEQGEAESSSGGLP